MREIVVLERIKAYFGIGSIYLDQKDNTFRYVVSGRSKSFLFSRNLKVQKTKRFSFIQESYPTGPYGGDIPTG
jgi:hypothetical protein